MRSKTAELDAALALARRWHDEQPASRKALERGDVSSVRVLGPVQIRLRSLVEERFFDFEEGPPPAGPTPVEEEPTDPWFEALEELSLEAMAEDAKGERTRWKDLGAIIRPCTACEGEGRHTCERCGGGGLVDLETCTRCGGEGRADCRNCRGTGRRTVKVRLARRFRFAEASSIYEGEDDEVGPHVLLHLVDHPTPGETLHEQEAPRIERYHGTGSGAGYREAASPMAAKADALLQAPIGDRDDRVVHQWLAVTRIPVYALGLGRGRTVHVYGDPPKVSPPHLLRPLWLQAVPFLVAVVLLVAAGLAFYALVGQMAGR